MDYLSKFSENLKEALKIANQATIEHGAVYVGSEHVIYGFLSLPACSAYGILASEGIAKSEYQDVFFRCIDTNITTPGFTARTTQMFDRAIKFAVQTGTLAGTAHLLLSVLESDSCYAVKILKRLGADVESMKEKTEQVLRAQKHRKELGYDDFDNEGAVDDEADEEDGDEASSWEAESDKEREKGAEKPGTQTKNYGFAEKKRSAAKKADGAREKLLQYGIDMTERAKKGRIDPVIGRKKEIEKVIQVLSRRTKNNPVLIGEPGVGKSAIAEGLSQLIIDENVPEQLYNKTVFSVDIPGMLAGARYRGDFEERLKDLIDAVMKDGDIILFIDEIHTIVGAGSSADNTMDAANILKPMLARGDLQVIGATTIEEYRKYIEKDSALERRFTPVYVEEPSETDTVEILKGLRSKYEEHHGIAITDAAIEAAVKLSARYITDRFLPDKAIDLIDEAAARARIMAEDDDEIKSLLADAEVLDEEERLRRARGEYTEAMAALNERKKLEGRIEAVRRAHCMERLADGRYALGKEQVAAIVSSRTKIPLLKITQEEGEKLMHLEEELHRRIVGQNEAVSAVAKAIRRARAGLKDPSRPIGSFIFVGPTGVGKTDLTKALAEALFGSEEQMIRLDMSEYMEKQSVSKLIGAPPGYVGYDDMQTGQLTDKVRTKPYCVILFDEIEKAHPDVFNLLLQLIDDGRLTDNKGRTISFKNAVVILTSNVGAAEAERAVSYGFGGELSADKQADADGERQYEQMKENITKALKERFRPEFLNRLDDIIVFHRLSQSDTAKIGVKIVDALSKRLFEQRGIVLSVTNAALEQLVKEGYDNQYGARPLKRTIQRRIEDRLSEEILLGNVKNGQRVTVDFIGGAFSFAAR